MRDPELRAAIEDYAQCLRREGVDASDAVFDEAGRVAEWPAYLVTDAVRPAERACSGKLAELAFRPRGEAAAFLERAQPFVDCMRDRGIAGIEATAEGIIIGPGSSNREIRAAERRCSSPSGP